VTLRKNTERPETIEGGSNILAGTNPEKILEAVDQMINISRTWNNPFGTGDEAHRYH
jgi:UDP-N-acetylglucosamine 2-epimerase (non-hydrolysing)